MMTPPDRRRILAISVAVGLLVALPIAAQQRNQDRSPHGEERFAQLDSDGDGTVSPDELLADPMARFDEADLDGDDRVTIEELASHARQEHGQLQPRMLMRFNHADADADGVLTRDEVIAAASAHFSSMDADADGAVTIDEAREGIRAMRQRRGEAQGRHGEGEGHGPRGPRGPHGPNEHGVSRGTSGPQ